MPNSTIQSSKAQAGCSLEVIEKNVATSQPSDGSVCLTKKLPYQANHQVELLHLNAEVEALLQQLRTLKQQRFDPAPSTSEVHEEVPALV